MNTLAPELSQAARERFTSGGEKCLLTADWLRALFIHYAVPAEVLQPHIPFALDTCDGDAFVSTVAFQMADFRPARGGAFGRWLFRPVANHRFLNLRTYIRHEGRPAIYFISEWLNHPLCVLAGPFAYGLPYRYAVIHYHHDGRAYCEGNVGNGFLYSAHADEDAEPTECEPGTLDEFLLERYTAFTKIGGVTRYFDIWHEPWKQIPMTAEVHEDKLIAKTFPWFAHASYAGANYSPGVRGVWLGPPRSSARRT